MLKLILLVACPLIISAWNLDHVLDDIESERITRHKIHVEPPQKHEEKSRAMIKPPKKHEEKERALKREIVPPTALDSLTFFLHDGSSYNKTVKRICNYAHNQLRERHISTPALSWDVDLAEASKQMALDLVNTGILVHSDSQGNYGENLFITTNTYDAISTPSHATLSWYSEAYDPNPEDGNIKSYNFDFNPQDPSSFYVSGIGHFSQVVWEKTTKVGCGVAYKKFEKNGYTWTSTVVVARYKPGGNILGHFTENVNPLVSGGDPYNERPSIAEVIPGSAPCKNGIPTDDCINYKGFGYCYLVEKDCDCECQLYN